MPGIHKRGPTTPSMNMTPLIDVTFQLIIFFMLVSNIIAQESVEMIVPKLDDPKTRELGDVERLTVNVVPLPFEMKFRGQGNPLDMEGTATQVLIQLREYTPDDLEGIRAELAEVKEKTPDRQILLRADGAIYYQDVQPIMDAISAAGIETVNVVAKMPDYADRQAP